MNCDFFYSQIVKENFEDVYDIIIKNRNLQKK